MDTKASTLSRYCSTLSNCSQRKKISTGPNNCNNTLLGDSGTFLRTQIPTRLKTCQFWHFLPASFRLNAEMLIGHTLLGRLPSHQESHSTSLETQDKAPRDCLLQLHQKSYANCRTIRESLSAERLFPVPVTSQTFLL